MSKKNPYSDKELMAEALRQIISNLKPYPLPHIGGHVSTLGGASRPSILLSASLDEKSTWPNGIYENSKYGNFYIGHDGTMEMTSGHYRLPKFRKTKIKNTHDIITKLHIWAEKVNN